MKGSISTRQKCIICGGKLIHDERRHGCFCNDHPQAGATKFIVRFPGGIFANYGSYDAAAQFLNYLRHEKGVRQERFNPDDYKSAKPNSFASLAPKYLRRKKDRASYKDIARMINRAAEYFDRTNVRDINGADIEDYLYGIPSISEKHVSTIAASFQISGSGPLPVATSSPWLRCPSFPRSTMNSVGETTPTGRPRTR